MLLYWWVEKRMNSMIQWNQINQTEYSRNFDIKSSLTLKIQIIYRTSMLLLWVQQVQWQWHIRVHADSKTSIKCTQWFRQNIVANLPLFVSHYQFLRNVHSKHSFHYLFADLLNIIAVDLCARLCVNEFKRRTAKV